MTREQLDRLANAQLEQLRRTMPLLAAFYWQGESGNDGQYAARDLAIAKRERDAQKGRD